MWSFLPFWLVFSESFKHNLPRDYPQCGFHIHIKFYVMQWLSYPWNNSILKTTWFLSSMTFICMLVMISWKWGCHPLPPTIWEISSQHCHCSLLTFGCYRNFQVVTTEIPSRSTSVNLHFHHFCGELFSIMSIIKSCSQLCLLSRAAYNYIHWKHIFGF